MNHLELALHHTMPWTLFSLQNAILSLKDSCFSLNSPICLTHSSQRCFAGSLCGAIPDLVIRQSHNAVKYLRSPKLVFLTYKMDLTPHFNCVGQIQYRGKKSRTECRKHTKTPFCVMMSTSRKKKSSHELPVRRKQAWSPITLAPWRLRQGK